MPVLSQSQLSDENPEGHYSQRTEHIVVEDAGNHIHEERVGGQTQRITVQPKTSGSTSLPSYEVLPNDGARARPVEESDSHRAPRVWNLHHF